jgi:uncharacterized protein YjbI with pentapeptide repeats
VIKSAAAAQSRSAVAEEAAFRLGSHRSITRVAEWWLDEARHRNSEIAFPRRRYHSCSEVFCLRAESGRYDASMADARQVELLRQGVTVWNDWRSRQPDVPVDLREADLEGLTLTDANLREVDLARANCRRTILNRSDLTYANCSLADFNEASLRSANLDAATFEGANLTEVRMAHVRARSFKPDRDMYGGTPPTSFRRSIMRNALISHGLFQETIFEAADLTGANLIGSTFIMVSLQDANLAGATLGRNTFHNSDVRRCRGLADLNVTAPIAIDNMTLRQAQGQLPRRFLTAAGLTDVECALARLYDPALTAEQVSDIAYTIVDRRLEGPIQKPRVFISYSRADIEFVDVLERELIQRRIRCWRDVHHLNAGRLDAQIDRAIRMNPIVIVVLSTNSMGSDWVEWELTRARHLERTAGSDMICPITIDAAWEAPQWSPILVNQMKKYNILDLSEWRDADALRDQMRRLVDGLLFNYSKNGS